MYFSASSVSPTNYLGSPSLLLHYASVLLVKRTHWMKLDEMDLAPDCVGHRDEKGDRSPGKLGGEEKILLRSKMDWESESSGYVAVSMTKGFAFS